MTEQVGKWRNWYKMKMDGRVEDKWGNTWGLGGNRWEDG